MTTATTTNEAAERLIGLIDFQPVDVKIAMRTALAGALAAERRATVREHAAEDEVAVAAAFRAGERHGSRATVERIRAAIKDAEMPPTLQSNVNYAGRKLRAILDEEAAR